MCGIVGYIGVKKAKPVLINGLFKLEYRGYDSAGIAVIENNEIKCKKDKGRVANLNNIIKNESFESNIGIAHTRWATHGKPSKTNSHPHLDNKEEFAVVHNGIIENYSEIREFLVSNGYKFKSETDTEVIPNLIHYYFEREDESENKFIKSVNKACKDLKGSYAIEVISKSYPDTMIIARRNSPLVLGISGKDKYIASDIPAIIEYTKDIYFLDDNEIVELNKDKVNFYNNKLEKINKQFKTIEIENTENSKDGFEDYMIKEIFEQPQTIRKTIEANFSKDGKLDIEGLNITREYLKTINKIYIVACGTAMHAGLSSKNTFERLLNIPVEVDIASEFRYRNPLIDEKTLTIFISQSGETADTIAALKLSKERGSKTIAVTNVIKSSITREADYTIYTHAGAEIAVASTKAYTAQVVLLNMLAVQFTEILGREENEVLAKKIKKDILELPEKVEETLKTLNSIKDIAKQVYKERDMFFLGRGIDYTVGMEGSLKLKEISYIHSEAYPAGELKHGPIALIEKNITVIGIITDEELKEKTISNIQEVRSRGAKIMLVTNCEIQKESYNYVIEVPKTNKLLSPILSVIPLQLFSYYISKEKGLDVDKPRNLAKSVTVE